MKDLLKHSKKYSLLFMFLIIFMQGFVQAELFVDSNQSDFSQGLFYRTFYNSSGFVQLNVSQGFLVGNFTSRIFDGITARWDNISWDANGIFGYQLPGNQAVEDGYGGVDMRGNVLLFNLNEGAGATTFFDSSGLFNNGSCLTLYCPVVNSTHSKFFNSFYFDGTNDRIEIPWSQSLNFTNAITLEAWIFWRGESGENNNIQNIITAGNWQRALRITEPDHWQGGSKILSTLNIGGILTDVYSATKISNRTWYHIVSVYNGTSSAIYINGKLDAINSTLTYPDGKLVAVDPFALINIGTEGTSTSNFYGLMDDVAIYNRSLSPFEIKIRYMRGIAKINLSVRSCDDFECNGESFISLKDKSPQKLNASDVLNNRYFQYKFDFISLNETASPNLYNVSIYYTFLNTPPSVVIHAPLNNSIYSRNISLSLNYSINDAENNVQSCWYNIDGGVNITLANCQNATFNTSTGNHILNLFVNDSHGSVASNSSFFIIDMQNPFLIIKFPQNISYNVNILNLNYTVGDNIQLGSCWYSLNGGISNFSIDCGQNVSGLNSNEGSNTWTIWANDSVGNINKTSVSFFVDSILPNVKINSPLNQSYKNSTILVNISVSELNLDKVWFFNGTANETYTGEVYRTFNEGNNVLIAYANDSAGNVNKTVVNFFVDTIPPYWAEQNQNVPSVYEEIISFFNITWFDFGSEIQSVWFESNFSGEDKNYSMRHLGNGVYGFNASLPAGIFYWRTYANDSLGNVNVSEKRQIEILKSDNFVRLYLNGNLNSNLTIDYGTQINATGVSKFGTVYLSRDGVFVDNPEIKVLGAKVSGYLYNVSVSESQNYSGNSTFYYLFVNKLVSNVSLLLNGNNSDLNIFYGTQSNASAFAGNLSVNLFRNGNLVSNPEISILAAGFYNYTAVVFDSENVSGSSATRFLNVTKNTPMLNLVLNGLFGNLTVGYGNQTNVSAYENNVGDSDIVYSLYKNGILLESFNDTGIYGAGSYIYLYNASEGQNYTSAKILYLLNITRANPNLKLFLNGFESNTSQTYGNFTNATLISADPGLQIILLRDNLEVSNGSGLAKEIKILAAGYYNYTGIFEGNQNYTSSSISRYLNIEKAVPSIVFLVNGYDSDISVYVGDNFNLTAYSVNPSSAYLYLYEENVLATAGEGFLYYTKNYSTPGIREWKVSFREEQNYSEKNVTHSIQAVDLSNPICTNFKTYPTSPTIYSFGKIYQFNATCTDDAEIDNVYFEFNGVNYSYSGGGLQKNGNEYFINLYNFASDIYSFRWHANDSSGNNFVSSKQSYVVQQAPTSLVIQISPGESVSYGTTTYTICYASNTESQLILVRDTHQVSIPDQGIFAVGNYNYFCNSLATQNYSAGSAIPKTLAISKANPIINLSLNGLQSNLILPSGGGVVNISASLISPPTGILNLSVDATPISSGFSPLFNQSLFNVAGNHTVFCFYDGNENYTSTGVSRIVTVSEPQQNNNNENVGSSGGGGGGGGVASSGGGFFVFPAKEKGISLDIKEIREVSLKRGTSEKIKLDVLNNGDKFLNNCHLVFSGDRKNWFKSDQIKGLSSGEKFSFEFELNVPEEVQQGEYETEIKIKCEEAEFVKKFKYNVYRTMFEAKILDYERVGNLLKIKYSIKEFAGLKHDVNIIVYMIDFDNIKRYKGEEKLVILPKENSEKIIEFDLPKDSFGQFNINLIFDDGIEKIELMKTIFLPTGRGITGGAISEANKPTLKSLVIIFIIGLISFFVFRFFRKYYLRHKYSKKFNEHLRRTHGNH